MPEIAMTKQAAPAVPLKRHVSPARSVLFIEDHPIVSRALSEALSREDPSLSFSFECDVPSGLSSIMENGAPYLLMLDLGLPGISQLEAVDSFQRMLCGRSKIAVISGNNSLHVMKEVLKKGADAYVPKQYSPEKIVEALQLVLLGGMFFPEEVFDPCSDTRGTELLNLTAKERDVFTLLAENKPYKTIAIELNVTDSTVKFHVSNIYRKLNVSSRYSALEKARQLAHVVGD